MLLPLACAVPVVLSVTVDRIQSSNYAQLDSFSVLPNGVCVSFENLSVKNTRLAHPKQGSCWKQHVHSPPAAEPHKRDANCVIRRDSVSRMASQTAFHLQSNPGVLPSLSAVAQAPSPSAGNAQTEGADARLLGLVCRYLMLAVQLAITALRSAESTCTSKKMLSSGKNAYH